MRRRTTLALVASLLVAATGCSGSSATPDSTQVAGLRVASFDFVESEILAELYAQAAEGVGIPVVRLGAIGPREIVVPAMRDGQVDLVPEYVGSALRFAEVLESPDDLSEAASLLDDRVADFEIDVLTPSSAADINVFVVSDVTADLHDLESVSDLETVPLTRFGGPAECPDRPYCLLGLRDVYGVSFEEFVAQPSLAFTAEALRRGEIDVGLMFSSSAELNAPDLVELVDDRHLQPPENVVPMLRRESLERWGPELNGALDEVSDWLTTVELRRLNGLVADGATVEEVAREWLTSFR